jgi:integral membrane sensor domain MASE1
MSGGPARTYDGTWALRCLTLAAVYFVAARLAHLLTIPPGYASPIWPSAGFAAGALAIWGFRLWPGVWVGAALANYQVGGSAALAAWIATGNTLEALCVVWLMVRWVDGGFEFRRPEAVVVFAAVAGAGSSVAATLAAPALYPTPASPRLAARWPIATGIPSPRRRSTLAPSAMSEPCTR